jgi:threonine/homoserine/homoserine lactone efflux protein
MVMLEQYWSEFVMLFILNLLNLISPGAGCALTMRNSTIYSRKAGLFTGFGIVCSSIIHKTYSLLGFGLIISQTTWLFNIIKYVGTAYLFYLGTQCIISLFRAGDTKVGLQDNKMAHATWFKFFKLGFFTDLLNPTASLGFITIISATLSPNTPKQLLLLYGVIMTCCSIIWYSILAYFFSSNIIKNWLPKSTSIIDGITGGFLIFLGIKLSGVLAL